MSEPIKSCVIYNPIAGRGRARRVIEREQARWGYELLPTSGPNHAEELARQAIRDGFRRIIAAGGDGTIHEIANSILSSDEAEVVLSVWPVGSANDYAFALGLTQDLNEPREVQAVDVGRVVAPNGCGRFFVNCLGLGFNAGVTVEARRIRWLRGVPLYSLALFKAMLWRFDQPMMTLRFDDAIKHVPTLALSLGVGKREGNFPILPAADVCDGLFDYMHAGPVSRWELVRNFPRLIAGRLPTDHPRMWLGRCRSVQIESEAPLCIHLDGEFFCQPGDELTAVTVELLPLRLRVERRAAVPANR